MQKIIFLDVDGVLNSYRNLVANGRFPWPVANEDVNERQGPPSELDPLAIGMVRTLCKITGAVIVFESTWRKHFDAQEFGKMFNLPMIGRTDLGEPKNRVIHQWLDEHPDVKDWIVIDDDTHVSAGDTDDFKRRHITTNMLTGFSFVDFARAFQVIENLTLEDVKNKPEHNWGIWAMKVVAENQADDGSHHGGQ